MQDITIRASAVDLATRGRARQLLASTLAAVASGQTPDTLPANVSECLRGDFGDERGTAVWGMSEALRALDKAVAWEPAVENAEANAGALRDAARLIARKALEVPERAPWSDGLTAGLGVLAALSDFGDVRRAAALLERAPLPSPVTNVLDPSKLPSFREPSAQEESPPVVLLRFTLDDEPVAWPMALQPGRGYRLGVRVTADAWPADAERLVIRLNCNAPTSVLERGDLAVARGSTQAESWLVPRAEINPDHVVELTPQAAFGLQHGGECAADVVGHRQLRISTFAPSFLASGQPMVAQRIVELLSDLDARIPNLPAQDRRDLVCLLDATTRFAAFANERNDLRGTDERGFQAALKQSFGQHPLIGRRVEEGPKLGGGPTDLVLGRIVDELKVSHVPLTIDDADKFVGQPTQYSAANDSPISMLTVLDDGPKSDPPGVASNYMRWSYPALHGASKARVPSMVVVVLIPIGFPVPSAWSRGPKGPRLGAEA